MKHSIPCKLILAGWLIMILSALMVFADEGSLTPQTIERIRSSFQMDLHTRAMYNALTNTDIKELALNRDILWRHDETFSHKIKTKGVTNQKSSGRCWLFAGLNVLRYEVIQKYDLDEFEFSQNYLAFWDKMEKANRFLEYIIEFADRDPLDRELETILKMPFDDGGYWPNVVNLIEKYGAVPKKVMPETNSSDKTSNMNCLIALKLRADAAKLREMQQAGKSIEQMRLAKEEMLSDVYRMLVMNCGQPPTEFQWQYKPKDDEKDDDSDDDDDNDADDDDDDDENDNDADDDADDDDDNDVDNADDDDDDDDADDDDENGNDADDDDNDVDNADDDDDDDENGNDADDDADDDEKNAWLYEKRTYTPKSFYQQVVAVDLSEYVNLFNDTTHKYGRHYRIKLSRNLYDGDDITYANVDIESIKKIAMESILDDQPVWFGADVGKDQSSKHGIMAMEMFDYDSIYDVDMSMTKAQRALYRESIRSHAMVFEGVDVKDDKPIKWWVENSWGKDNGSKGYWTLYDSWFDNHVYNIVVKKEYVPENILKIFDQEHIVLPAWDPMLSVLR